MLLALWCVRCAAASPPPRVITLAPHLTELAYRAGITPVAVSDHSDYPPAARTQERVASWQTLNVERILALQPDVVLAWQGNADTALAQLRRQGIRVELIDPTTPEQIAAALDTLARFSPHPQQAQQAAAQLRRQFAELRRTSSNVPPLRAFVQVGVRPLFTTAAGTLQHALLTLCGAQNIFADSPVRWPQVSLEQVLLRRPDVIIVSLAPRQAHDASRYWATHLNAPVITLNPDWFNRAGPRSVLAARSLCQQLAALRSPAPNK